ncbi:hypothetical protein JNUCC64_22800 [Streptomyces sp. JNUCC 64]
MSLPLPDLDDDEDDDEEERPRVAAGERPTPPPQAPRSKSGGTPPATTGKGGTPDRDRPPATEPAKGSPSGQGKPSKESSTGDSKPMGSAESAPSNIKSYPTEGGRVVFDLGVVSAKLVSAKPAPGWSMQAWKEPGMKWIRVDFTATESGRVISVSCLWHNGAPNVEINNYE